MKKYIFIALLLCTNICLGAGNSGYQNIKSIKIEGEQFVAVYPAEAFLNPDNCEKSNIVIIQGSDTYLDKKLSLVLAAYMGGKKIQTYMTGCTSTPWGYTAPVVFNVVIAD